MFNKTKKLTRLLLIIPTLLGLISLTSCTNDSKETSEVNETRANSVRIKSIVSSEESNVETKTLSATNGMLLAAETNSDLLDSKNNESQNVNFVIIYKSQTDITFTITLDNPEAYGIDALRITCDDENAEIMVDEKYEKIAYEDDKTRVVNWNSENAYKKTYNIRTTSPDSINSFKVTDIRLAGHEKFQSKETNSEDLGNNELRIYKMDDDAYKMNIIENNFDYIKFNFTVKDEYKDIISNLKVDGVEANSDDKCWTYTDNCNLLISYDYLINDECINNLKVNREEIYELNKLGVYSGYCYENGIKTNQISPRDIAITLTLSLAEELKKETLSVEHLGENVNFTLSDKIIHENIIPNTNITSQTQTITILGSELHRHDPLFVIFEDLRLIINGQKFSMKLIKNEEFEYTTLDNEKGKEYFNYISLTKVRR